MRPRGGPEFPDLERGARSYCLTRGFPAPPRSCRAARFCLRARRPCTPSIRPAVACERAAGVTNRRLPASSAGLRRCSCLVVSSRSGVTRVPSLPCDTKTTSTVAAVAAIKAAIPTARYLVPEVTTPLWNRARDGAILIWPRHGLGGFCSSRGAQAVGQTDQFLVGAEGRLVSLSFCNSGRVEAAPRQERRAGAVRSRAPEPYTPYPPAVVRSVSQRALPVRAADGAVAPCSMARPSLDVVAVRHVLLDVMLDVRFRISDSQRMGAAGRSLQERENHAGIREICSESHSRPACWRWVSIHTRSNRSRSVPSTAVSNARSCSNGTEDSSIPTRWGARRRPLWASDVAVGEHEAAELSYISAVVCSIATLTRRAMLVRAKLDEMTFRQRRRG
jgi:hypothetical protein